MNTSFSYSVYFRSPLVFCITMILVVSFASSTTFITRNLAQNERDEVALRAFKSKIIHDPQGALNSWNESRHFCEWEGITCGSKHRRVIVLDLSSRGMSGSLSPYIGNLSFLRELRLYNNSIQGEIPHEFGRLFKLRYLLLLINSLVGELPANLSYCSKLIKLSLGNNKLVGKIPPQFVSLYNLKLLSLHMNNLTGRIPPFLGNLTSLETISFAFNAFKGNIPDSLDRLKMLSFLGLGSNSVSGAVPPSLYNLSSLQCFSLSHNQLHGSLPSNLGFTLPNLQQFQIRNNFFTGHLPISLSNASIIKTIEMRNNYFVGKLSIDFGGMQNLLELFFNYNNLGSGEVDEMNFINSLANCSNLLYLGIGTNHLRGVLPHSIGNLSTKLQVLDLDGNQLYGSISLGIANLVSLNWLNLEHNQFTGPIPKEFGKLHNIQMMSLNNNQLSGEIPSSLGNLSWLGELYLYFNKFSGVIPSSIGNLKQLLLLDLSENDLSGTIPEQIFTLTSLSIQLNLAQNHLVGLIPRNIGKLKSISMIDVSNNNLFGEIPNEISLCSSLEYLYMEGNFFHGSIPPSFSSLKGIRELDLSHNNLSGQIPKFMENLPLEKLNLSFNDFEGEVPTEGIFKNASAIAVVGRNSRLCGGIIELQLRKCPKNDSKKEKTSLLFKTLIPIASGIMGLTMILTFIFCWFKKRREKQAFGLSLEKTLLRLSYENIIKATDGFAPANLIGRGSFGSVYKGILDQNGTTIAIKVLNLQQQGASKSFMAECKTLKNIRHRNLLKVITSCSSIDHQGNDFKAIIYDFMTNGSLEKWLHPPLEVGEENFKIQSLTLLQRVSIAIDVASALGYLHHHCQELILHCDLKPSNVLLDEDMTAHVGDFGLARFLPKAPNPNQSSSIGVKGTIGYTAPEYGLGSEISANGDIYSFGILLLEMMTGKTPTDCMFEGDLNLHNYSRMALPERVLHVMDPVLINEEVPTPNHRMTQAIRNNINECLVSLVRIGVACSMESPQDRMNITNAISELQLVKNILLQPSITGLHVQRGQ